MEKKKWYLSKAVWAGIIGVVVAALGAVDAAFGTGIMSAELTQTILAVLAALGIYGRVSATTKIE